MAINEDYLNYVVDQLQDIGVVSSKRMFGGVGLYADGLFFALIEHDTLRFKVDDSNRGDYEAAGMEAFQPYADKPTVMNYYEVPIEVLEDSEQLKVWADKAINVALTTKG